MIAAIQAESLSKTYRKTLHRASVDAICDISFSVAEGEAFGFIGPNGAGKSSTIRIIMGLGAATRGRVSLFGTDVSSPSSRLQVGYVPESPYLYDYLTPLEILQMGLRLHRVSVANPEKHCLSWLERLDLAASARAQVRTFSKGMMQRVAIAQALSIQPRLLILDEPLSGLDPIGRHDVVELLAEYKRAGGTLFFTSHVLHDVERLADRFGLIHRGQLRSVRSPSELVGMEDVCQVRTLGSQLVHGMQEESPGRWVGQVTRNELWNFLSGLQRADHIVVEIRPTMSLEQAFMHAVR